MTKTNKHTIAEGGFSVPPRIPCSLQSRVERFLEQMGPATANRVAEHFNVSYASAHSALRGLLEHNRIHASSKQGKSNVYTAGAHPNTYEGVVPKRSMSCFGSGTYDGLELRRNPGIPAERFLAFELPSVVNGVRVPARRITAQCVGNLKEVANPNRG